MMMKIMMYLGELALLGVYIGAMAFGTALAVCIWDKWCKSDD